MIKMRNYDGICTRCGKHTKVSDVEFEPDGVDMIDVEQLCEDCESKLGCE